MTHRRWTEGLYAPQAEARDSYGEAQQSDGNIFPFEQPEGALDLYEDTLDYDGDLFSYGDVQQPDEVPDFYRDTQQPEGVPDFYGDARQLDRALLSNEDAQQPEGVPNFYGDAQQLDRALLSYEGAQQPGGALSSSRNAEQSTGALYPYAQQEVQPRLPLESLDSYGGFHIQDSGQYTGNVGAYYPDLDVMPSRSADNTMQRFVVLLSTDHERMHWDTASENGSQDLLYKLFLVTVSGNYVSSTMIGTHCTDRKSLKMGRVITNHDI